MSDDVDKTLAEIDMLALADAVGVYRSGPVELGPVAPKVPDSDAQRDARRRQAHRRFLRREERHRWWAHTRREEGTWPYPDTSRPTEEQLRDLANELVRDGWDPEYLARRFGLTRRSQ